MINDCNTSLDEDAIHRVSTDNLFVGLFFQSGITFYSILKTSLQTSPLVGEGFEFATFPNRMQLGNGRRTNPWFTRKMVRDVALQRLYICWNHEKF
ncbi:MAG: hypothetical protein RMX65_014190 [Nostoc sp. DedQUE01]|nr:hypothetical protein [Nostoc sp. DedQUE01]